MNEQIIVKIEGCANYVPACGMIPLLIISRRFSPWKPTLQMNVLWA